MADGCRQLGAEAEPRRRRRVPALQLGSTRPGIEEGVALDRRQALHVKVEEADENLHTFSLDNYGSEFTGEVVANLRLQGSNKLRLGEVFIRRGKVTPQDIEKFAKKARA